MTSARKILAGMLSAMLVGGGLLSAQSPTPPAPPPRLPAPSSIRDSINDPINVQLFVSGALYSLASYQDITRPSAKLPTTADAAQRPDFANTPLPGNSNDEKALKTSYALHAQVVDQKNFDSGLSVTIFQQKAANGEVQIFVAFRGTEPTKDPRDLKTDAALSFVIPQQFKDAKSFIETNAFLAEAAHDKNATITFVGHSLGGGIAQYCGLLFGRTTIAFNAVALGKKLIESLGGKQFTNALYINHVVIPGEPVFGGSQLIPENEQFGTVSLVKPSGDMIGGGLLDQTYKRHLMAGLTELILEGALPAESMTVAEANKVLRAELKKDAAGLLAIERYILLEGTAGLTKKAALESVSGRRDDPDATEKSGGRNTPSPTSTATVEPGGNTSTAGVDLGGGGVKGVLIDFDERILADVLAKGSSDDNAKLVDGFIADLTTAKDERELTHAVAVFQDRVTDRYFGLREKIALSGMTTVSLKALVARAEKHKGNWNGLPEDLRRPGNLTRLHGFSIVEDDIILIGAREKDAPVLELDDLVVGVRAVWRENATPLVSLDPDPADMGGDPRVRIQGVAADSAFALTMLEADYAMKKIMAGVDPIRVPGFRTLKDTLKDSTRTFLSRFWLYPVQPGAGDVRVSSDLRTAVYAGSVRVLSEEMLNLKGGLVGTGQAFLPAEEAADSFTDCYEKIAAQRPVFRKLRALFDLVLTARIWRVRGLQSPLLDRLCALPHRPVKIPASYPAIHVLIKSDAQYEYWLQGGVQAKIGAGRRAWLNRDSADLAALETQCRRMSGAGHIMAPLANLTVAAIAPSTRPDTSSRDYTRAVSCLLQGDFKTARAAVDRLLVFDRYDAEALILRALIRLRSADYTGARADALAARDIDTGDRDTAAAVGQILFVCDWMEGNPENALRLVDDTLTNDLQSPSGQVARGEALLLLDRPDEARQAFMKALELDPACVLAYARLAQLEFLQGRLLAAKPWIQKAQALDADLPEVRIAAAQWELATVRPDRAGKIATEVWENQASGPTARLQALAILAAISASREKWNDVDTYVGLMEELDAGSPEVLLAAAEIALQWGERPRAAKYLEKALQLSPHHPLAAKLKQRLSR